MLGAGEGGKEPKKTDDDDKREGEGAEWDDAVW